MLATSHSLLIVCCHCAHIPAYLLSATDSSATATCTLVASTRQLLQAGVTMGDIEQHSHWLQLQADDYSAWVSLQTLHRHPDSLLSGLADTAVAHGRDKLRLDMSPEVAREVVAVLRLGDGYAPPEDGRLLAALQVGSWCVCVRGRAILRLLQPSHPVFACCTCVCLPWLCICEKQQ